MVLSRGREGLAQLLRTSVPWYQVCLLQFKVLFRSSLEFVPVVGWWRVQPFILLLDLWCSLELDPWMKEYTYSTTPVTKGGCLTLLALWRRRHCPMCVCSIDRGVVPRSDHNS